MDHLVFLLTCVQPWKNISLKGLGQLTYGSGKIGVTQLTAVPRCSSPASKQALNNVVCLS